jgi:hypothetical protein
MKSSIAAMCAGVILFAGARANGQVKADVEGRAAIIAPLIDQQTLAVAHVDLKRFDVGAILDQAAALGVLSADEAAGAKLIAGMIHKRLVDAGVKEFYAIFTLAGGFRHAEPFFAVPIATGSDEKAIRAILPIPFAERRGDVLVLAMHSDVLERLATMKPDERPELPAALEAAGDTAVQFLFLPPKHYRRVLEETVSELPKELGGGSVQVFTRGILWAAAGIDGPPHAALRVTIQSEDARAAGELHDRSASLLRQVGSSRNPATNLPDLAGLAAALVPRVEGNRLVVVLDDQTPDAGKLVASLAQPIEKARRSAAVTQSLDNVKQIALAMLLYEDTLAANGTPAGKRSAHFPLPAIKSRDGKPLLSWRVAILPQIEQRPLYDQFHLDESWDSPHNRPLVDKMPKLFQSPLSKKKEPGWTNYLLPVGNGAGFSADKPTTMKDITDGTANTIMVVEVDDDHAAIWTKPDDWQFDPDKPAQGLGSFNGDRFIAGFFDGSCRVIRSSTDPKILKALFTRAGGEVIEPGSY